MKTVLKKIIFLFMLMMANVAYADLYTVSGVAIAAQQDSAVKARDVALAEGQVEAFNQLVLNLAGETALSQIPPQDTESVTEFIQDVSLADEKLTSTRYSGRLTVRFRPAAVNSFLKSHEIPYLVREAPTMLVIPVYQEGNTQYILDDRNPLYQALKKKSEIAPFYRAIVPMGDANEVALTERALHTEQELSLLSPLLSAYNRDKILVLRMRVEPTNETVYIDSSVWPTRDMSSQTVFKKFHLSSGSMTSASGQMADAVFATMAENWRNTHVSRLDGIHTIYARTPVSSLQEWQALEQEMAGWKFVDKVVVRGAYLPQMLVELSFEQSVDEVKQALAEHGWILDLDFSGSGASLTRGGFIE